MALTRDLQLYFSLELLSCICSIVMFSIGLIKLMISLKKTVRRMKQSLMRYPCGLIMICSIIQGTVKLGLMPQPSASNFI